MINSVAFDTDTYLAGITIDSIADLVGRRAFEELTQPHRVDFYALMLVTEGSGYHYIDNKLYHCRPGTLLVLSPHQVHYFDARFQWEGYIVTFQDSEVFPIDNMEANFAMTKALRSVDIMNDMLDLIGREVLMLYEEFTSKADIVSASVQRNLVQNIMFKTFYRSNYSKTSVSRSRELEDFQVFSDAVEHHFAERHNVSEYICDIRMSAKRLNTVCMKIKGVSAKQIIDSRLILEAKRLIGYTTIPISDIALSLGFNEPTNLAKFFPKHTDISPTEFRNMSKQFADRK